MENSWPTFSDVLRAYKECRVGKPSSFHQNKFEARLGENLLLLTREIQSRKYKPSRATTFVVTHPKPREIFAAHFRDRIVHHLIVSKLQPIWEKKFSHASFACRKGRGTHGALKELQKQVRQISQGGRIKVFVLQLDIASFFVSIHKPTLKKLFLKRLNPKELNLIWLINIFMDHDPRKNVIFQSSAELMRLIPNSKSWLHRSDETGLPIGNLTSQFGANVYLNDLDHWIVRKLKPKGYIRYMDDLTLFDTDENRLKEFIEPIDDWIRKNRKQELNPTKTSLYSLRDGIDYLGYRIIQSDCPKNPAKIHSTPKRKWDFIKDLKNLERVGIPGFERLHTLAPEVSTKKAQLRLASVNSRLGLFQHSCNYQFKKNAITKLGHRMTTQDITLNETGTDICTWSMVQIKSDYSSIKVK